MSRPYFKGAALLKMCSEEQVEPSPLPRLASAQMQPGPGRGVSEPAACRGMLPEVSPALPFRGLRAAGAKTGMPTAV